MLALAQMLYNWKVHMGVLVTKRVQTWKFMVVFLKRALSIGQNAQRRDMF